MSVYDLNQSVAVTRYQVTIVSVSSSQYTIYQLPTHGPVRTKEDLHRKLSIFILPIVSEPSFHAS